MRKLLKVTKVKKKNKWRYLVSVIPFLIPLIIVGYDELFRSLRWGFNRK